MNEECKYCKIASTCLEMAEYGSIYCQLHKRIPKAIDKTYEELQQENQELKEEIKELELILGLKQKRKLISKFDEEYNEEYNEENKKKHLNDNHAEIIPDAEEIYKRYYKQKEVIDRTIKYCEKQLEYGKTDCIPARIFACEHILNILKEVE